MTDIFNPPALPSRFNRGGLAADLPVATPALMGVTWTYADIGSATYTGRVDRCDGTVWVMIVPPTGTFAARRQVRAGAIFDRPPIATRSKYYNQDLSDGTKLGGTSVVFVVTQVDCFDLSLVFGNYAADSTTGEKVSTNVINVKAAISINGQSSGRLPAWFNGSRTVTLSPGATVKSLPIGCTVPAGTQIFLYTYVTVNTIGDKWPQNLRTSVSSGEGDNYANPAGADVTDAGNPGGASNHFIYAPVAVLGSVAA